MRHNAKAKKRSLYERFNLLIAFLGYVFLAIVRHSTDYYGRKIARNTKQLRRTNTPTRGNCTKIRIKN